ncbi:DUF3618 domain-containing protein [Tessaracoccus sp. OH4464_COT-324]|uniref:DUF3618 domain-containing protein n=1 Tax=Tessaracoccus sp. OH4464_COT-324 TaxID=2491059 RepID=UPI00131A3E15|nr:DUF3618 domain-containing protein [Tessaracoccus sp. OH4464_COT-324]
MAKERTVEDIRAEMAQTRRQLQNSFAELRESLEPKKLMRKSVDEVKSFAKAEYASAKAQLVDERGGVRAKRVLAIAGAVVGTVVFYVAVSRLAGTRQLRVAGERKAITAA